MSDTPIYLDTSYSFAERAADLVSRMTLDEKASQMISSRAPAIPRLGVREYGWWNEALHGVSRLQLAASGNATTLWNTTSYPIDLSLGATWDPELLYQEATMISDEAREVAPENMYSLDFWSPTINLVRDPRWGRTDESYSEDPFLTASMAAQFVNGMEGRDMEGDLLAEGDGYLKAITTLKHYAANNSEVNRRTGSSDMDDRSLREYYTAAFRQIVEEANVSSVMSSYNEVNGVPASASVYLLDNLLRQTFGFDGYVTSDCDSIMDIETSHHWIPPGETTPVDSMSRSAYAMTAGVDLECNAGYQDGKSYINQVPGAVAAGITTETGLFTENDVDTALVRLFTARMQLGEFDAQLGLDVPWITEARARVAEGTWVNSNANMAVTETAERLDMARKVAAEALVLLKNDNDVLPIQVPESGEFNVAVLGYFAKPNPSNSEYQFLGGYSSQQGSNAYANHTNPFDGISQAIAAINPDATVTYYKGFTDAGTRASQLLNVDADAVAAAAAADVAIVYVATDSSTANEAGDRANVLLPGAQGSLISQVALAQPNTVAVMETIGMVDVRPFEPDVPAMLWSSYNGQQKGAGLADVLLGVNNPSGHLPFTWFEGDEQLPAITDYTLRPTEDNPGRTYMYFSGPVSYPFGYGLSYTDFEYSRLRISDTHLSANDKFKVKVDVTNTGSVAGDEIVQLYATTPDAAPELERPIKRLIGFEKVSLEPGETKTVSMWIDVPDLAFYNEDAGAFQVDTGRYGIQVANDVADVVAEKDIYVYGTLKPELSNVTVKPTQAGDAEADIPTRVLYDKSTEVIPQITVAMSDDTLYGYIAKGQSVDFPRGMDISYSSNRPNIVSVDRHGRIMTQREGGVATITATVKYKGERESVDFVVYVDAKGYLDGISVNGIPIEGFSATTLGYDVVVPYGVDDIPQVAPITDDPDIEIVSVEQADAIPGAATIVTKEGMFENTYVVSFGRPPLPDDFTDGVLGDQWRILNEDPASWAISDTGLTITTQEGDLIDGSAENVFLQPGSGDWLAETHITLDTAPAVGEMVGMTVYGDEGNYVKAALVGAGFGSFTFRYWRFVKAADGTESTISQSFSFQAVTDFYFRIGKSGSTYSAWYSTNGTSFSSIGTTSAGLVAPEVGLFATNGAGSTSAGFNATFEYFSVDSIAMTPIPIMTVDENEPVAFTVEVTSTSENPVTVSVPDLPEGATFDPLTMEFAWTPSFAQAGTYELRFVATDGNLTAGVTATIIVNDLSVKDQIRQLERYIDDLQSSYPWWWGGYDRDLASLQRSLLKDLDKVGRYLDGRRTYPDRAISILENSFIPDVQDGVTAELLSVEEGDYLVSGAQGLIVNISDSY